MVFFCMTHHHLPARSFLCSLESEGKRKRREQQLEQENRQLTQLSPAPRSLLLPPSQGHPWPCSPTLHRGSRQRCHAAVAFSHGLQKSHLVLQHRKMSALTDNHWHCSTQWLTKVLQRVTSAAKEPEGSKQH